MVLSVLDEPGWPGPYATSAAVRFQLHLPLTERMRAFSFGEAVTTGNDVTGLAFAASLFGGGGSRCPSTADHV